MPLNKGLAHVVFAGGLAAQLIALGAVAAACSGGSDPAAMESPEMDKRPIEAVLLDHTAGLMALPGVVGVAQSECDGRPCIRVLVVEQTDELSGQIPSDIEGYPVAVDVTGEIKALDE